MAAPICVTLLDLFGGARHGGGVRNPNRGTAYRAGTSGRSMIRNQVPSSAPRRPPRGPDPNALARLAARGLGVAILPASVVGAHAAGLRAVAVASPHMRGRVALAWRSAGQISPAARALIDRARTVRVGPL